MAEIMGVLVDIIEIHDDIYVVACDYDSQLYSLIRANTDDVVCRGYIELVEYHIQRLKRGENHEY